MLAIASYSYYMSADVHDSSLGLISLGLQAFSALLFTIYFHAFAMSRVHHVRVAGLEPEAVADRGVDSRFGSFATLVMRVHRWGCPASSRS